MKTIRIYATSDSRESSATFVEGFYAPLTFELPFDPRNPRWEELRHDIERKISREYGGESRHWVWGMYGSLEDGRTFDKGLYDYWFATEASHARARSEFTFAVARASHGDKHTIKAKWSWPQNGCADTSTTPTVNARDYFSDRDAVASDTDPAYAIEQSFKGQVKQALLCNVPKVAIMKFSRFPEAFRDACDSSPELVTYRKSLENLQLDTVLDKGCKVYVTPKYYPATRRAIDTKEYGDLLSSHMVVDLELVDLVRALGETLEGEKVSLQEQKCKLITLGYPCDIEVERTFIHITPKTAGPKTVSTTDADKRRGKNPRR